MAAAIKIVTLPRAIARPVAPRSLPISQLPQEGCEAAITYEIGIEGLPYIII
jgi:hypothetical protein